MVNEIVQSIDSSIIPITVDKDDNTCHEIITQHGKSREGSTEELPHGCCAQQTGVHEIVVEALCYNLRLGRSQTCQALEQANPPRNGSGRIRRQDHLIPRQEFRST
jgi:hypothetical protein